VNNDWLPVEAEAHQSWPPKNEQCFYVCLCICTVLRYLQFNAVDRTTT